MYCIPRGQSKVCKCIICRNSIKNFFFFNLKSIHVFMPICIFLCRAAYWWFLKDWLHWSHLKHLLSSWVFSWVLKLELCEKDLPHLSHEKGLCPVCILSRASKWYLFENDLLHFEQESGFSPLWALWTFMWEAKEEPCANDIRHVWHEKGFYPECTLSWLLN